MTAVEVSVVIPTYNAERFIARTIESALSQRGHDGGLEIVVVDDGSTDGTVSAIEAISAAAAAAGVMLLASSGPRQGVSIARNEGIRKSRGPFVAFLDHDDLWEPEKIASQVEILRSDPAAHLVFTQAKVEQDDTVTEIFPLLPDPAGVLADAYENLVHWNYIPMSAVMVRKSRLPEVPFDPRYQLAEDWDLWLRIASADRGAGVRFIARPLTRYRIVEGRATRRMADLRLEDIAIFNEQIRLNPWLEHSAPARCRETLRRLHEEAGYWLAREGRAVEARRALGAAWLLKPSSFRPLGRMVATLLSGGAARGGR